MIDLIQSYIDGDLALLPVALDGSKSPAAASWSPSNSDEFSAQDILGHGIGIKCGAVSGNLVVFDFEGEDIFHEWLQVIDEYGLELHPDQPVVATPRPGFHVYVRLLQQPPAGEKLAMTAAGKTLIETRGEGHYVCAPGSPDGVHANGSYELVRGSLDHIPCIDMVEFQMWRYAAHELSAVKPKPKQYNPNASSGKARDVSTPGGDYNVNGDTWDEILEPEGFKYVKTNQDGADLYQKPHSSDGGQHIIVNEDSNLYCFSTSCPPFEPETPYSKFAVYTLFKHGGDYSAAASALSKLGYGRARGDPAAATPPQEFVLPEDCPF